MKGSRGEWIVLAAALAVMAGVSLLAGEGDGGRGEERAPDRSTYNARGSGTKALYLWLRSLEVPVRRWERPLEGLPEDARVLLVLQPRYPLEDAELNALGAWVRAGGVLVLADDAVGGAVPGVWAGAPVLRFGLRPRLAGGREAALRPAYPTAYATGVEAIQAETPVRFQRPAPAGWAPLFADSAGDVVGVRRLGRGTVIAVADPGLWSNARLEVAGHARLALNIVLAHAGQGAVLVDEFHHGHGAQSAFVRYLRGTSLPWILAQGALVFLALLLARGTRFGPPAPAPREERATSLEYVAALGDLYRRAGARRVAAETLAAALRRDVAAAGGAAAGEEPARLAALAARRLGLPQDRVRACLAPGPAAAASDDGLMAFARAVHRLRAGLHPEGGARGTPHRGGGAANRSRGI